MPVIAHFAAPECIVCLHFVGDEAVLALVSVRIAERTDGISTDLTLCASLADKWDKKNLRTAVASLLNELRASNFIFLNFYCKFFLF